jgi:hypothetical protein
MLKLILAWWPLVALVVAVIVGRIIAWSDGH